MASLILDCLFYSLLCDFRDEINDLSTQMYHNLTSDKEMKRILRDIKDPLEIQFIREGIYLFMVGTSIYYDLEAPSSLKVHLEDLKEHFPDKKKKLITIYNIVTQYLEIYSISSSKSITAEQYIHYKIFKDSKNPYLLAGFLNIYIKYMKVSNKIYPLDNYFFRLFNLMEKYSYKKFSEGYYYLLFARYKLIKQDYNEALSYCDYAILSTNECCPRNGARRRDIISLRETILSQIEMDKKFEELEKTKNRFNELKLEIYKLVGIILPVIVIPISVLIAFLEVQKEEQSINLVLLLLGGIVISVLLTSFVIISIPYLFRLIDNTIATKIERNLKNKKYGFIKGGEP